LEWLNCKNIIVDGYEFICADNGEVLNPHQVPHLEIHPSDPSDKHLEYRKGLIDTYLVPREEEDERFYKLVKAQTRAKYGKTIDRAMREFDKVVEVVKSRFNVPQRVVDMAKREYRELLMEMRLLTERRVRRYAVVMLYYWMRREGIPISYRDYVRLFDREAITGFTETYEELSKRYGAPERDYRGFLLKGLSFLGLQNSQELYQRAIEIAEMVKQRRATKPNILALVAILLACEERGIRVPKTRLAEVLGAINYYKALKYARSLVLGGSRRR